MPAWVCDLVNDHWKIWAKVTVSLSNDKQDFKLKKCDFRMHLSSILTDILQICLRANKNIQKSFSMIK